MKVGGQRPLGEGGGRGGLELNWLIDICYGWRQGKAEYKDTPTMANGLLMRAGKREGYMLVSSDVRSIQDGED